MSLEKWIGEKDETGGSYYVRGTPELKLRKGGSNEAKKLYRFESRFDMSYYITDPEVIDIIESLLKKGECRAELVEYLYRLVVQEFGAIEFITMIGHKISEQRDEGYQQGKFAKQREIIKALGLD